MSAAAVEYFVLGNFDVHAFLEDYVDSDTIPTSGTNELDGLLPFTPPGVTKDVARYRIMNANGWEALAPLGQSQSDCTVNLLRTGTGDVFIGATAASTYSKVKSWALSHAAQGGQAVPKCFVVVRPRSFDSTSYEGVCYFVIPSGFADGEIGENGQEYSVTVSPFGPPIPIKVTKTGNTYTFSKPA